MQGSFAREKKKGVMRIQVKRNRKSKDHNGTRVKIETEEKKA